jgi:hypothetical protein
VLHASADAGTSRRRPAAAIWTQREAYWSNLAAHIGRHLRPFAAAAGRQQRKETLDEQRPSCRLGLGHGLFDLTGRVAAVIGGAGVLGGTVCHGFGDAGASDRGAWSLAERADELVAALEAKGVKAAAFVLDASDQASVEAAQKAVEAALGPVDILVNAVGINSSTPFFELGLEEWNRVLQTNLTSCLLACQIFGGPWSIAGRAGRSSTSRRILGVPLSRVLTYSVSKAGDQHPDPLPGPRAGAP